MKPASILKRIVAFFIDKTILTIILFILGSLLTAMIPSETMMDSAKDLFDKLIPGYQPSFCSKIASYLLFYTTHLKTTVMIVAITYFVYFVGFEQSKWEGTIGKKLLKLKVVDSANKRISAIRSAKRLLLLATPAIILHLLVFAVYPQCLKIHHHLLSGIEVPGICMTLFVGYAIAYLIWFLPVFFTKEHVTLYDALSHTKVKG